MIHIQDEAAARSKNPVLDDGEVASSPEALQSPANVKLQRQEFPAGQQHVKKEKPLLKAKSKKNSSRKRSGIHEMI